MENKMIRVLLTCTFFILVSCGGGGGGGSSSYTESSSSSNTSSNSSSASNTSNATATAINPTAYKLPKKIKVVEIEQWGQQWNSINY